MCLGSTWPHVRIKHIISRCQIGSTFVVLFRCLWPTVAMSKSTTDLARAWEKDDLVRINARKHQAVPRKNFDHFGGSFFLPFLKMCKYSTRISHVHMGCFLNSCRIIFKRSLCLQGLIMYIMLTPRLRGSYTSLVSSSMHDLVQWCGSETSFAKGSCN